MQTANETTIILNLMGKKQDYSSDETIFKYDVLFSEGMNNFYQSRLLVALLSVMVRWIGH